jgi:orotate phosphoribosyltransferase
MAEKQDFVRFLIEAGALRFGDFTTKSGRKTPYFINTGMFRTGPTLARLSEAYAGTIKERFGGRADNLFGPAYKGIPLCAAAAIALDARYGHDLSFTYNRKEAKDHGEGGILVGDAYDQPRRVVIVEDVVTAGTSVRETFEILSRFPNAQVVGLVVSVDRKERLDSGRSALDEISSLYGIEAYAIATIDDVIAYLERPENRSSLGLDSSILERIHAYRREYGAKPSTGSNANREPGSIEEAR